MIELYFSMSEYGFYVWSAWGMCLVGLILMVFPAFSTRKKLRSRILVQAQRQARLAEVESS